MDGRGKLSLPKGDFGCKSFTPFIVCSFPVIPSVVVMVHYTHHRDVLKEVNRWGYYNYMAFVESCNNYFESNIIIIY